MNPTWLLFLSIVAPAFCGLAILLLPRKSAASAIALALLGPTASFALLSNFVHTHGVRAVVQPIEWVPAVHLNLSFLTGTLSLFFAFLIASFGFLILLYSRAYFGPDPATLRRFYPCLLLFMTAMLGLVLSDSFVLLLVFWELTSISSFLLIGWNREDPDAVKKAVQALLVTGGGGLFLLAGLVLLGIDTHAWSITQLANTDSLYEIAGHPRTYVGLLLIFIGAAAKSAQMPLHFWLPGAMAAPTPVSAYLHSATMVKAGVYLVAILTYAGGNNTQWPLVLVPVGIATMLYAAFIALQKSDLKQIFAYCTVSQLGLLMASYGVPWLHHSPRVDYDAFQILSHALYKAPLFLLAGAISHIALTRELPNLRGIARGDRTLRLLALLLLIAGYALASGPFTLAFAMKERFLGELWSAYQRENSYFLAAIAAVVLASAFNVAIFVRIARTLLARPDATIDPHPESSRWNIFLWAPAALLLVFQLLGGILPATIPNILSRILGNADTVEIPSVFYAFSHLSAPLLLSLTGFALGIALGFSPFLRGPTTDSYDRLFPWCYSTVTRGGGRVFALLQNGDLGFYIAAVFTAAVALFLWSIGGDASRLHWPAHLLDEPTSALFVAGLLTSLACIPALLMPFVEARLTRVLLLGATGFGVTCIYYAWHAPDLALTQISIEVISIILFLLVLAKLPDEKTRLPTWTFTPRLLISLAVGAVMFWLTLSSSVGDRPAMMRTQNDGTPIHDLGTYFLRNSNIGVDSQHIHKGGGGNNVVNVILVDFRGFDTLGEITVLGLAAMGVWMLLRKRAVARPAPLVPMTSLILRSGSRLIVPASLLLAIFIYFKGHQSPGGGFVAGLVTAVGLMFHRMSNGPSLAPPQTKILPLSEHALIALGLLLALTTGAASLFFGLPFFTSNNGFLPLPGDAHGFHWATVMVFDLGVFFVVTGVTVGMINAIFDDGAKGGAA